LRVNAQNEARLKMFNQAFIVPEVQRVNAASHDTDRCPTVNATENPVWIVVRLTSLESRQDSFNRTRNTFLTRYAPRMTVDRFEWNMH
jgi:hypothetical protein